MDGVESPRPSRRPHLSLPVDPSDEELARNWTLSEADQREVRRCRGDGNRLRFAVQLCTLRIYGRYVNDFVSVPARIANYVCRQFDMSPVLFIPPPEREATDLEHERRIRSYLGFERFDRNATTRLERRLAQQAERGVPPDELVDYAEGLLRSWKVIQPARSSLERLVRGVSGMSRTKYFAVSRRSSTMISAASSMTCSKLQALTRERRF